MYLYSTDSFFFLLFFLKCLTTWYFVVLIKKTILDHLVLKPVIILAKNLDPALALVVPRVLKGFCKASGTVRGLGRLNLTGWYKEASFQGRARRAAELPCDGWEYCDSCSLIEVITHVLVFIMKLSTHLHLQVLSITHLNLPVQSPASLSKAIISFWFLTSHDWWSLTLLSNECWGLNWFEKMWQNSIKQSLLT